MTMHDYTLVPTLGDLIMGGFFLLIGINAWIRRGSLKAEPTGTSAFETWRSAKLVYLNALIVATFWYPLFAVPVGLVFFPPGLDLVSFVTWFALIIRAVVLNGKSKKAKKALDAENKPH